MKKIKLINLCLLTTLLLLPTSVYSINSNEKWHSVATNNCGSDTDEPFLIKGDSYVFPETMGKSATARSCTFGSSVIYAFDKMDIHANYRLEALFLSDSERKISILADGNQIASIELTKGKEELLEMDLPKKAFAYGQLVLVLEAAKGPNAVISQLNIYSSNPQKLAPFVGDAKRALINVQNFNVDTLVCAESVLPQYTPVPVSVNGTYKPSESLNGIWKFNGEEITVPGQWSMQGFAVDSAQYGTYEREFSIPKNWKGNRIKIKFDGVFSESTVTLNGKKLGSHMGGLTAFEYDVTDFVKDGENKIKVDVRSESMADMLGSLTQYAAHQLGGITRKVTLFAVPEVYISDIRIETDLDKEYKNAELKVRVSLDNPGKEEQKNISLRITIDGLPVVLSTKIEKIAAGQKWTGTLSGIVSSPIKWDNEHPNLYNMAIELADVKDTKQRVEKRFGFREIQVQGNQLLVNGKAVKLRGVCRHEAHPLTGRVLSIENQRRDIELYRAANCNFIRTSHYPPAEEFINLCDEMGMFVEVEAPVCWIGHHANENWKTLNYRDSIYYPYVLQANMEMIQFYRNSPSVLFWSMANESYWNKEFAQILEYIKKADTTRPNAFHDQGYGGFNNQGSTASISNIHYPGPGGYKNPAVANCERPITYGEFCHLNVYNRSELVTDPGVRSDWALALAPTWENMYNTQAILGGSIWSGIDDIFQLPNGDAVGYGPWGPIDGWRRAKPEYWDMKKIYSPIRLTTKKLNPSNRLALEVENRYTYMNLSEMGINWKYGDESGISFIDLKPGEKGTFSINIKEPSKANELYISFTDPRGFVADEYLIPIGEQTQNSLPQLTKSKTELKDKKEIIEIKGKEFYCSISKETGKIVSITKNKKEIICGGPHLMVLPLDGGGCYPNHNANTPIFNDMSKNWVCTSVESEKIGDDVKIHVKGQYDEFSGQYTMTINANGEIGVTYDFNSKFDVNPRQWGMIFDTPKEFDKTFWRRDGMWSVYPEDHISRSVGEAELFYEGLPQQMNPRTNPAWAWSKDFNELGSNDFRSTRRNVWYAGLKNRNNSKVTADSKGEQHWRSWKDGDKIRFLIADFTTAGYEMFLGSYYAPYRKPLKKDDTINGTINLRVE